MSHPVFFTSHLEISNNRLWGAHLPVPDLIARIFVDADVRRVVCSLNGTPPFQCALLPKGEGVYCIVVNKKLRDLLHLKAGSQVQVSIHADESEYGLPMPEELAELLAQDEDGNRLFHSLTPGKIRSLLYIIGQVKKPEARLVRAIIITEHLKKNAGKIHFRPLIAEIKTGL